MAGSSLVHFSVEGSQVGWEVGGLNEHIPGIMKLETSSSSKVFPDLKQGHFHLKRKLKSVLILSVWFVCARQYTMFTVFLCPKYKSHSEPHHINIIAFLIIHMQTTH